MERAVILLRGEYISEKELPLSIQRLDREVCGREEDARALGTVEMAEMAGVTLAEVEKKAILRMLKETEGNKSETARRLGITRRTLQLKLKKYEAE